MMNIQFIDYRIAQTIAMIDKISKNEIEIIVWALISLLMMRIDDYRNFSMKMKMMNRCRDFLIDESRDFLMNETDHCKDCLIFLIFLMIVMKMKMIVWENFSQSMTREMILWVIAAKRIW